MEGYPFPNPALPIPLGGYFIPSSTSAPEFIFETEKLFSSIQFYGEKAAGVANTSNVDIYIRDEDGEYIYYDYVPAGVKMDWLGRDQGPLFNKLSFKIKSNTTGDGVRWTVQ